MPGGFGRRAADALEVIGDAGARAARALRHRQRGQSGGVRDRDRAVRDADDITDAPAATPTTSDDAIAATPATDRGRTTSEGPESSLDDHHLGARLDADLAADRIAAGHAFVKHVVTRGEYPHVRTRTQFARLVEEVILHGQVRPLRRGRTAYWYQGTIVIRDRSTAHGGSAYRPPGIHYFLNEID